MTANTEEAAALLGCPFCGGDPVVLTHVERQDDVRILCGSATCGASITWWHPRREAIAAWNRRAAMPARAEVLAKAAANYVRCSKSGNLSPYIKENGLTGTKSPWAELCEAVAALATKEKGNG